MSPFADETCGLWLVFEILEDGVEKRCNRRLNKVYIVAPSPMQMYRTTSLHDRTHFQLSSKWEVEEYTSNLRQCGLAQVHPDELYLAPSRFYTILDAARDHFLDDISVVNMFIDPSLISLAEATRLHDWANYMNNPKISKKVCTLRGCRRMDIGLCAQSHNDPDVVLGMNAPKYTTKFDESETGLDFNKTATISMMETALALREMAYVISDRQSLGWDEDFGDEVRNELNAYRAAKERGLKNWERFVFEGVTVGLTGDTPDGKRVVLSEHEDDLNGISVGYDVYYGFSAHVWITVEEHSTPTLVRAQVGGYGKRCACHFMSRFRKNMEVLEEIRDWKHENPELFDIGHHLLTFEDKEDHRFIRPMADKSVYYSLFIETILYVGEMCKYDLGMLYECVYLLTLTPSPFYWYVGVLATAASSRRGRNFAEAYVEFMVGKFGAVSASAGGDAGRRRQPSHGGFLSRRRLYQSLVNMKNACAASMEISDSGEFLKLWAGAPEDGGVFGAGTLIAQEQIYLMAALGILRNYEHSLFGEVGSGTETWARLKARKIIGTPGSSKESNERRVAELVRFLSINLDVSRATVEHFLCEVGRDTASSKFDAKDTLVRGQSLYAVNGGILTKTDKCGHKTVVNEMGWAFGRLDYDRGVRWWETGFEAEGIAGDVKLTVNAKTSRSVNPSLEKRGKKSVTKRTAFKDKVKLGWRMK